ncbi:hypothetical protein FRB96_000039 [Tulasnella sp. 330]|nr:hypothetical protein FRB96_000039 [Tulasnella sp. 330]
MTLETPLSPQQLDEINAHLEHLTPQQILKWALDNLPSLYQTTAFGLTGLAGVDMLSKLTSNPPPLIFIDTLYHFQETIDLKNEVERKYGHPVHVYKPKGVETPQEFEQKYGERLWETNDIYYDYLVKIEPGDRANEELGVKSVITGRRASQGGDRSTLKPLEVDEQGLLKLNPFFAWNFAAVKEYVDANGVPRNALLDQGYKSVGDWHSTVKSGEGDQGERAGRWAGKAKTECGLHVKHSEIQQKLDAQHIPRYSATKTNQMTLAAVIQTAQMSKTASQSFVAPFGPIITHASSSNPHPTVSPTAGGNSLDIISTAARLTESELTILLQMLSARFIKDETDDPGYLTHYYIFEIQGASLTKELTGLMVILVLRKTHDRAKAEAKLFNKARELAKAASVGTVNDAKNIKRTGSEKVNDPGHK